MKKISQYIHRPNLTELGMGNTNDKYLVCPESEAKVFFPEGKETTVLDEDSGKSYILYSKIENSEFRVKRLSEIFDNYQMDPGDELIFTRYETNDSVKITVRVNECGRIFLNQGKRESGLIKDFEIINSERFPGFSKDTAYDKYYSYMGEEHHLVISFSQNRPKRADSPQTTDFYNVKFDGKDLENLKNTYYYLTIRKGNAILKMLPKFESKILLDDSNEKKDIIVYNINKVQQIFYGAPGTSKSHTVKELVDDKNQIRFRTTFHPDSDYSTFVGCYKPRSHKKNMLSGNGINETQLLSCFFNSNGSEYKGKNKARYLYEALVHTKDIRDLGLDAQMVSDKLNAQGFTGCAYTTEATCMYNIYDWLKEDGYIVENKLTYEFTPQAFVNAYVEAWRQQKSGTPVYLIIEEINRGNCAQIFGDLFQLLDRDDNGFSRYEVTPDSDLQDYIASLGLNISDIIDRNGNDISSKISKGELLKLPDNFYIWATMNTSDQSLFPIDSAFKRRWDWKYMPIEDAGMNWEIHVNGNIYNWYDFLVAINKEVLTLTHSEDKQLGYFFAKAKNNIIDAETLVNKVYFYLWTDVFKDYDYESQKAFRKPNSNDPIAFKDFFNGREVNGEMAEQVLINLDFKKPEVNAE